MASMADRAPGLEPDRQNHEPDEGEIPEAVPIGSADDRRSNQRVRLDLEIAVPVRVMTSGGEYRGMARNISEGGMLVELVIAPAIGSRVCVTFEGVQGSESAPDAVELHGEVRHHMAWQYNRDGESRSLRGVGIRFVDAEVIPSEPLTSWVWRTGHTIH